MLNNNSRGAINATLNVCQTLLLLLPLVLADRLMGPSVNQQLDRSTTQRPERNLPQFDNEHFNWQFPFIKLLSARASSWIAVDRVDRRSSIDDCAQQSFKAAIPKRDEHNSIVYSLYLLVSSIDCCRQNRKRSVLINRPLGMWRTFAICRSNRLITWQPSVKRIQWMKHPSRVALRNCL